MKIILPQRNRLVHVSFNYIDVLRDFM